PAEVRGDLARLLQRDEPLGIQCDDVLMLKGLVGSSELISLAPWDVVAADVEAGRLALLPWPAGAEPARAKGSAYGLVSRAGRSLSPAAAVFVERVLEQDRRFAAT
ncbi:LysR family transcriptional regulator, partial [Pseudomonas aeruginosa]|nr:LysR family transcriptional regulator [Pseudomonas aeruginosa]